MLLCQSAATNTVGWLAAVSIGKPAGFCGWPITVPGRRTSLASPTKNSRSLRSSNDADLLATVWEVECNSDGSFVILYVRYVRSVVCVETRQKEDETNVTAFLAG